MGQKIVNRLKECNVEGYYVGGNLINNYYGSKPQDSEREFIVTRNANIKPTAYFVGRETELQELRQRINAGRKSVLVSGMGGIGKTQICRKLFEEYSDKPENGFFRHIGYIEYDGGIDSSLQRCLKFEKQDDPEQNNEAAWRELEYLAKDGKLLLFVDNVNVSIGEDPSLERLKNISGAIILTSRRRVFTNEFETYLIDFLSAEKCREIYEVIRFENSGKRVAEEEVPDLKYIIDVLAARHTITIEFLAHLAWTKNWAVKKLRDELEGNGFRLKYMDEEDKMVNIQKSYEALYDLSVLTDAEQNILEAFSVFPYIPLAAETCNEWLLADAGVSEEDSIFMGLYRKGWLQFDMEQESFALHPVFAQFVYEKCKPEAERHSGLTEACRKCLRIPESGITLESQKYIPYAESMIEKLSGWNNLDQAAFASAVGNLLYYAADYKKAEGLFEYSLRIRERVLGKEHLYTAMSYNELARLYVGQGEYKKAEELYKRSLRISEKVLGEEDPYTAVSYGNLAGVYEKQGEYKKAEELYEKSLRIREKVLGEEHPNTAVGYHNLGVVYERQGEYKKAEELYEKSLRIRERALGEEHPDTAVGYHNLAGVYERQGEYKKAEELYEKSLSIKERVLGEEHPNTAASYNDLAVVYEKQGEYEKAEGLYEKSLRISERALGEEHPDTATSYGNLAGVYECQGKHEKAEGLYEKSLRIRERALGEEHPDTATSYHNLAAMYVRQKEYEKAEGLYEKSQRIRERALGEEHPDTAMSYHNMAELYFLQGNYEFALAYFIKAYKILMNKLGIEHPNTKICYQNMQIAYAKWKPKGGFEQWLEDKLSF